MLINETYLKQYSPIPLNFDWKEMTNYVEIAESIWIRPLLGESLYEEICDEVENDNLTPENSTLLVTVLWRYLGFATCLEGLAFLWTNVSEVGITLGKSENSDSVTLKDLTFVEANLRRQTEVLKEQTWDFLESHAESFPLWDKCSCACACGFESKLKLPNPYKQIYSTRRPCTAIR